MTPTAITLRLAEPADARSLALMSRDLIEAGLGWKYDPARIARAIGDPNVTTLVAWEREDRALRQPGGAVGFSIMQFGEERAHLVLLAVRPGYRREGIGQRMIEWLVESALTAGIASLHLELRETNEAARAFYRAQGFTESLRVPGYYSGKEPALRMIRMLRTAGPLPAGWQPPPAGRH